MPRAKQPHEIRKVKSAVSAWARKVNVRRDALLAAYLAYRVPKDFTAVARLRSLPRMEASLARAETALHEATARLALLAVAPGGSLTNLPTSTTSPRPETPGNYRRSHGTTSNSHLF